MLVKGATAVVHLNHHSIYGMNDYFDPRETMDYDFSPIPLSQYIYVCKKDV